jgi:glycosyltransferase involved in cell wall biosynthesis
LDEKNIVFSLSDFIRENKIDIILNNVPSYKTLKFILPALQEISKQSSACKILFHFHTLPGYERATISPGMYWMRLMNDQCKLNYVYKLILQFTVSFIGNKLLIRHLERKYRSIYQSADKVVLLSSSYVSIFANYVGTADYEKLTGINNALSFSNPIAIDHIGKKQKEALIVARLDEVSKKISQALKIWKKIECNSILSEWKLTIVGDGEDKRYYQKLVKRLKLKRVFFEGTRKPDIYYERASIFIMTSAFEGFPMTLTEAQQMGAVPISFDSFGAVHDIIENGNNGFIIPNNDTEKYAAQLAWLMQHDEERQVMACNAVESSKRFHPAEISKQWVTLFEELKN